jgi:hypothetical protein
LLLFLVDFDKELINFHKSVFFTHPELAKLALPLSLQREGQSHRKVAWGE